MDPWVNEYNSCIIWIIWKYGWDGASWIFEGFIKKKKKKKTFMKMDIAWSRTVTLNILKSGDDI